MEVKDLFEILKYNALLATQLLRNRLAKDLGNVVVDDVTESADVVSFGLNEFLNDES